jgi:hypothetical protein
MATQPFKDQKRRSFTHTGLKVLTAIITFFFLGLTGTLYSVVSDDAVGVIEVISPPCYTYDLDCDGDVDIVDVMLVASRWNTSLGDPNYDAQYDLDGDGDIDIVDVMKIAVEFSEEYALLLPTGYVVSQNPAPGTEVAGGSAVELVLVKAPPAGVGEVIGDTWAGEWRITITSMNTADNTIVSADQFTVPMCAGDPIGWTLLELVADESPDIDYRDCSGLAVDNHIETSCVSHVIHEICTADVAVQFDMDLHGNTLIGTGSWTSSVDCVLPFAGNGESFVLLGKRQNMTPPVECASPASSLMQKLMPYILRHVAESLP